MSHVKNLMAHNNRGDCLPEVDFLRHLKEWDLKHPNEPIFGPIARHTWEVDGFQFERPNPRNDRFTLLPDSSGFLLCERTERPDNLLLLDVYGQERMRLSVPWQMTGSTHPDSGKYPTRFIGKTTPWENPTTGEPGRYGVLAWVDYAGDHYFELDYKTGKFLWCKRLERY
jgi:hypothetical protein